MELRVEIIVIFSKWKIIVCFSTKKMSHIFLHLATIIAHLKHKKHDKKKLEVEK